MERDPGEKSGAIHSSTQELPKSKTCIWERCAPSHPCEAAMRNQGISAILHISCPLDPSPSSKDALLIFYVFLMLWHPNLHPAVEVSRAELNKPSFHPLGSAGSAAPTVWSVWSGLWLQDTLLVQIKPAINQDPFMQGCSPVSHLPVSIARAASSQVQNPRLVLVKFCAVL